MGASLCDMEAQIGRLVANRHVPVEQEGKPQHDEHPKDQLSLEIPRCRLMREGMINAKKSEGKPKDESKGANKKIAGNSRGEEPGRVSRR